MFSDRMFENFLAEMLRAHLSPVGRLCGAKLTKRSTSEVGLGTTVVGVSLIGKPGIFSPAVLCAARNMAGQLNQPAPETGKQKQRRCAWARHFGV
jgi:hypothetical protein